MHKKGIKQKIIAIALCFVMLLGVCHIENFINTDISATTDDAEAIYGITSYDRGITGGRTGKYKVMIPSLNRGFYGKPKEFWFIQINEQPAFCLDLGKSMGEGLPFVLSDDKVDEEASKHINAALQWFTNKLETLDNTYEEDLAAATTEAQKTEITNQYDEKKEELYSVAQVYIWTIMTCYEPNSVLPAAGTNCATCRGAFVEGDVYCTTTVDKVTYYHHMECHPEGIPQLFYTSKICDGYSCDTEIKSGDACLQDVNFFGLYCYRCNKQGRITKIEDGDNYYYHDEKNVKPSAAYISPGTDRDPWTGKIFCEDCFEALKDGEYSYTYSDPLLKDEFTWKYLNSSYGTGSLIPIVIQHNFEESTLNSKNVYCTECAKNQVSSIFRDAYAQYQTSIDLIKSTNNMEALAEKRPIEIMREAVSRSILYSSEYVSIRKEINDIKEAGTAAEANIYYYSSTFQRLATYAAPIPPPDPTCECPYPDADDDEYRERLNVQHNITGTIDSNGKGVIGSWEGYTSDPTSWHAVCNENIKDHEHTLVTVTKEEKVCNCKLDQSNLDAYSWETYGGSEAHYDYSYKYVEGAPNKYYDGLEGNPDWIKEYGYTIRVTTWTTYECCYCLNGGSQPHNIYHPKVDNYTLTLNYQGGWLEDGDLTETDTKEMNSCNYSNATYSNVVSGNKHNNVTTTETTAVAFTEMRKKGVYKFNSSTEYAPYREGGVLGEPTGVEGSEYTPYTHAVEDGSATLIEFLYKNYYIVSLPEPTRTGYNWLGWYTDPVGGTKVEPVTASPDGKTYNDVYVITADTTLYAHWELITKDETITIHWMDNSNSYTTRPDSVYVELWRYTSNMDYAELCEGYITENINSSSNDWIIRFSNETGMASDGDPTGGIKTTGIFDPNVYLNTAGTKNTENNIFETKDGNFYIKISGDNITPTGSNTWTVNLKNLQKYDTYNEDWYEYTYVVKEVICESLDTTTQYYTNPENNNKYYKDYSASLSNFYSLSYEDYSTNSGQKTRYDYDDLDIKNNFSNVIVNRLANKVLGINTWKDVTINISFQDGPQNEVISGKNTYDDDIYHFRPYSMRVDLYQNYAYGIDKTSNDYLSDIGVRVLYKSVPVNHSTTNPWSATNSSGIVRGTVAEKLANMLRVTFKSVPTIQDETCIKIAYDAVVTHGNTKYRYTINSTDENNNLGDKYSSNHYYANKHEEKTTTITDLDYDIMYKGSNKVTVVPTVWKEITAAQYNAITDYYEKYMYSAVDNTDSSKTRYFTADMTKKSSGQIFMCEVGYYQKIGYVFPVDNENNIYQDYLKQEDDKLVLLGQNNVYQNTYTAVGTKQYLDVYKSMAYNIRYYKITEDRDMDADSTYDLSNEYIPFEKRYERLYYKENLVWDFVLTLNHADTKLPTEYSGSASEDDRTGNYNGVTDDDFTFTNNVITITNKVYSDDNHTVTANDPDYDKLLMNIEHEDFLITFKQVQKIWNNQGHNVTESYNNDKYSTNGYMYIDNSSSMKVSYKSNTDVINNAIAVGNDYNILVPANGSVTLDYLPDGKYEITCHYDIDFDNFDFFFEGTTGTAKFTEENGKYYVTLSSKDVLTEGTINHAATIDYWRGYVNDQNNNNSAADNILEDYITYKSSLR